MTHTQQGLMAPPGQKASVDDQMDFLHQQLDSLGMDTPILNGLVMLGCTGYERLQGGPLTFLSLCCRSRRNIADNLTNLWCCFAFYFSSPPWERFS